jgi:type II secretory pathway predicted ATPase ExeA
MHAPYLNHFGLVQEAFKVTPDPSFLYMSASHREALAQLSYGIKARRGFVVLTGEVGTGKTTLTHALLNELGQSTQTALIFHSIVNPLDLLRYVCEDFGLLEDGSDHKGLHDYFTLLNRFLLDSYRKGQNCALIIDEAQNLSSEVLESIRILSNFETSQDKLLQILLVGQPELAARLNSPELRQLKQRVTLRYHLRPLSFVECREYIARRLEVAGGDIGIFTTKALESVYRYAAGIPRLVNVLCDNGMLTAYALEKREVDAAMVREVADDLNLNAGSADKRSSLLAEQPEKAYPETADRPKARDKPTRANSNLHVETPASETPRILSGAAFEIAPGSLLDHIVGALTDAMGPLAPMVVREKIAALREHADTFPLERVQELVTAASEEVLDERLRARFQQEVLAEIGRIDSARAKP